ncbi:MAG TPA: carboxypeptidase regulatory-like domain-containing protein [Bryobacteraceae bacterium]|nr:carboxypeptidase regulatory-like domain-containing protein [Bryobacteraceae bacterium]
MGYRWFLLLPLLGSSLVFPLWANDPTGTITGTVSDISGAVVPKARVTVVNEGTNATREAVTNDDGDFTMALLPPGHYRVSVEKDGFRRTIHGGVDLDVDQTARVDFTLQVGILTEEVKVTDTQPIVQTDTSTLGQVIDGRLVHELPLNERNFLSFALLAPGSQLPVSGSQNSTQGGAVSVNGAREQSNNFLLEGVDNNDPYINQYVALPSIDAIQEFKVQSGNYSAEFGRSGGAQVNVILKSGTNQFHGVLFEFLRNRNLDAKNFFDQPYCTATSVPGTCGPIPSLDRDQFGGTFGGPIRKDRTFFFVSYEGLRLRQATTREATVPSQYQKQLIPEILSLAGYPENPSGLAILNLYPAANVGPNLTMSNTFVSSPVIRNAENLGLIKVDHHVGRNDTISAHWAIFDENRFNPFDPVNSFTNLPGYGSFTLNDGQNGGLSWNHVFTSAAINEFRVGFNRMRAGAFQQSYGNNLSAQLGFPDVLTNPVDLGYPEVNILGFDGIGEPLNYPQDRHDTTVHFSDNLSIIKGRNQFKFGADIRDIQIDNYLDFVARGDWFFEAGAEGGNTLATPGEALAQLVAGAPDYAVAVKGDTFNTVRSIGMNYYIQDDIHVVPRLLLNVGLRYEYNSPGVEDHNRYSVPDLSANSAACTPVPDCQFIPAGTNGIPRSTYNPTVTDFAPRIGIAWRPMKTERWVVRAAYGIFYDAGIFNINVFPRFNPPFYDLSYYPNNSSGVLSIQQILNQPATAIVEPNMIARNFRDGYMQQWNVDLQYEVRPYWMVDAAYVGSKGTHLSDVRDLNQVNPVTGLAPYPQFSSILFVESGAASSYNSLQLRTERRAALGLTFLAAYTFSKSIDDVSAVFGGSVGSGLPQNSQDPQADRGVSDFNVAHRLVVSSVYDLPFGRKWVTHPGWRRSVLGNWQAAGIFSAQTGSPFTVNLPASQSGSAIAAFGNPYRPDLVSNPYVPGPVMANPNPACHTTISQGGLAAEVVDQPSSWFNTCAFAEPPAGQFGNAGRNIMTGPGFANLDYSMYRNITLGRENHRLQLRAEVFNLFNHPNFDIPNHVFGGPNFGEILSVNSYGNKPPRQIQLGLKYIF